MGHVDDVRVAHAAGDVVPGIVEEEDEAHLVNGAGTALGKKRGKDTKACRERGRQRRCRGSFSFPLDLQPAP